MKRALLIKIALISFSVTFGQEIRPAVKNAVARIRAHKSINSSGIGFGGVRTSAWTAYEVLKERATDAELVILTNHENKVVRCYAFQALAAKGNIDLLPVLKEHLNDTSIIVIQIGCGISFERVGDFFIDVAYNKGVDKSRFILADSSKHLLDSLLIFTSEVILSAKNEVLRTIEPVDHYYDRIREVYTSEKNDYALVALSKFQKIEDKQFIINMLQSEDKDDWAYGLVSMIYYPDLDFLPSIQHIHEYMLNSKNYNQKIFAYFYQAIAKYRNEQAVEIMSMSISANTGQMRKYHIEYIWLALERYPDPVFNGILDNIELSDARKFHMKQDGVINPRY